MRNFQFDKKRQETICEILGVQANDVQSVFIESSRAEVRFSPSKEEREAGILSVSVEKHIRNPGTTESRSSLS